MVKLLLRQSCVILQKVTRMNIGLTLCYCEQNTLYKEAVVAHSPPLSDLKSAAQLFRGNVFLNLKSIFLFGRIAMLASADNERGFSLFKEIETDRRCNLDEDILNSLMMIASNGPTCKDFRRTGGVAPVSN